MISFLRTEASFVTSSMLSYRISTSTSFQSMPRKQVKHVHFQSESAALVLFDAGSPLRKDLTPSSPSSKSTKPLPTIGCDSFKLHKALRDSAVPNLHIYSRTDSEQITFDLSLTPDHVKVSLYLTPDTPATQPSVPHMTVTCALLPWTMTISPRTAGSAFVTVYDVIETLYNALRTPVTPAEYTFLPGAEAQEAVNRAFRARCKKGGDAEMKKGVKRIDFLCGRTKFCGLKANAKGTNGCRWTLEVS